MNGIRGEILPMGIPECASGMFIIQSGRIAGTVWEAGQINVLRWQSPVKDPPPSPIYSNNQAQLQLLHPAAVSSLQVKQLKEKSEQLH